MMHHYNSVRSFSMVSLIWSAYHYLTLSQLPSTSSRIAEYPQKAVRNFCAFVKTSQPHDCGALGWCVGVMVVLWGRGIPRKNIRTEDQEDFCNSIKTPNNHHPTFLLVLPYSFVFLQQHCTPYTWKVSTINSYYVQTTCRPVLPLQLHRTRRVKFGRNVFSVRAYQMRNQLLVDDSVLTSCF